MVKPAQAAGQNSRSSSLAAIFLLVAVVAVVTAMVQSAVNNVTWDDYRFSGSNRFLPSSAESGRLPRGSYRVSSNVVEGVAFLSCLVGTVIGAAIGFQSFQTPQRRRGLLLGGLVGALVGAAAGVLLVCPADVEVLVVGSLLIVLTGVLPRWLSKG